MFKFILGPLGGYAAGLNLVTTVLVTVAGMMTVVISLAYSGEVLQRRVLNRFFSSRKKFSAKNRKIAGIWKKYGLAGIALLTPLVLTPIGGTLIAISFGTAKNKLILYMFVSAAVWSVIFTALVYFFGNEVLPDFIK